MAETKKIVKYRKPFHLNIEIVIFVIILVYILSMYFPISQKNTLEYMK